MSPHSMNDGSANDANHRRAKSNRVAPAIPYALVKPKSKPAASSSAPSSSSVQSNVTTPSLEPVSHGSEKSPATPVQNAPLTPASATSSHPPTAIEVAVPSESLTDHTQGPDATNTVETSSARPSEPAQVKLTPKPTSPLAATGSTNLPPASSQQNSDPPISTALPNGQNKSTEFSKTIPHETSRNHPRRREQALNGGRNHARTSSDVVLPSYEPNGSHAMHINTAVAIPPPSMIPSAYGGEFMSPPITSPISGWNPNANFIPPNHQMHFPRRSMHDSMSPRAASHNSSTSEAQSAKLVAPLSFSQPLPPVDIFPWSSYINTFYSNSRFADFSLVSSRGSPEFPAHGLIISKSSVLSQLILRLPNNPKRNDSGQIYLNLSFDEHLTSYTAVLEAIGHLYGQPLPNYGENIPMNAPIEVVMDRMTSALALAGAGQYLGLPEVMSHGIAFAIDFITWQTFERALAFAQASMNSLTTFREADNRSNELIKVMYHYHSNLLFRLERFLIDNFPRKFQFLPSAPDLTEARRLPKAAETRPSFSHARLASIQFGDMPTQDPSIAQSDSLISSILLAVPTAVIGRLSDSPELVKKLGRAAIVSLLTDVVNEREKRRTQIVKSKTIGPDASHIQQEELKWMEVLEQHPQSPLGVVITKTPVEQEH